MIYGFQSEFMFRINVLVKKKKKKPLADSRGFPAMVKASPFGNPGSWELPRLMRDVLTEHAYYRNTKSVAVTVEKETQEGFFLLQCFHGFACLLPVPLFSKIPFFLFVPQKA